MANRIFRSGKILRHKLGKIHFVYINDELKKKTVVDCYRLVAIDFV